MSRAHLYRPVTDSEGNIVPNTKITLYEPGTTQLLQQPIYQNPLGSLAWTNPWTTSDGYANVYLDRPQTVRVGLTVQGSTETYIEDIPVEVPAEQLVMADTGFQIINTGNSGQFLQSGATGIAAWVDAADIVNSKPTPLFQAKAYDWSNAFLDDATITDAAGVAATPTYPDVSGDTKPSGWAFAKALQVPTTGPITITTHAQTYPESGTAIYLYKVVSTAGGVGAATLKVSVDNDLLYSTTPSAPDLCNVWMVGYLEEIPSGTHKVTVTHTPGSDTSSYVLLGPIWLQYGNNIPAHDHPGTGVNSTRIGTGAVADTAGSTVVGATATALDANAAAFGFGARAGLNATAIGTAAVAGTDSVAIGHTATGAVDKLGITAVGKGASASDTNATALGVRAVAQGVSSVAIGPDSKAGAFSGPVAIGSAAQALAVGAVALGQSAVVGVGHDYSLAIGPGVATTAAHQAMIGDSATTIVVPGSFRQTGGDGVIGGPTSKIGFFGSAGIARPTVLGSRGGNATLAQLLTLLDSMGLVKDSSTS